MFVNCNGVAMQKNEKILTCNFSAQEFLLFFDVNWNERTNFEKSLFLLLIALLVRLCNYVKNNVLKIGHTFQRPSKA